MKVVFLDIDGVLQPHGSMKRFDVDRTQMQKDLSEKFNFDYTKYSEYDVAAVWYDWDKDAVERIRNILEKTHSKIVISSDWRDRENPRKMIDLLRLYGLDIYWAGQTARFVDLEVPEEMKGLPTRVIEILTYLKWHKEVTKYVVIDDLRLVPGLEGHFVETDNLINDEQMEKCIEILGTEKDYGGY